MSHFKDLEFDLPSALLRELIVLFEEMAPAVLSEQNVLPLADGQGVYQLFHRDKLVYIGKTDNEAGLRKRLLRHCEKIRSRLNLISDEVSFKAVRIYVFTAMDLESALIRHYKAVAGISWNNSGFGSNNPGRNRDHSALKSGHFDALYPIDLNYPVTIHSNEELTAASLLVLLKEQLPFTVRFLTASTRSKKPHPDLMSIDVRVEGSAHTARSILKCISRSLPIEWQITALPGYVIVYKEKSDYSHGEVI